MLEHIKIEGDDWRSNMLRDSRNHILKILVNFKEGSFFTKLQKRRKSNSQKTFPSSKKTITNRKKVDVIPEKSEDGSDMDDMESAPMNYDGESVIKL